MASSPEAEISLAQRFKRSNDSLTPARKTSPKRICAFPNALLATDDTVLNALDLDFGDDAHYFTNSQLQNDDNCFETSHASNTDRNLWETSQAVNSDLQVGQGIEKMDLFEEDDLDAFDVSQVYKTTQVRKELEKIFDKAELSKPPMQMADKSVVDDFGPDNFDWHEETLLQRASPAIESMEEVETELRAIIPKHLHDHRSSQKDPHNSTILEDETPEKPESFTANPTASRITCEENGNELENLNLSEFVFKDVETSRNLGNLESPSTTRKTLLVPPYVSVPNEKERDVFGRSAFAVPKTPRQWNRSFNETGSFYGLSKKVQILIQQIKGITELYQWQDECLNLKAIKDRKNLVYALPTSGGKTLVAEILMLREIVINKKNAVFILPFVAIVQEKVRSLAPFALELDFLVEEYAAGKGTYPPKKRRRKNSIYVCTIEKGLGLINSLLEIDRLNEVGIIVVDELHLLGENGGRGATLEGLLTKVMFSGINVHIVGMSATIGNLNEVADFLNADVYTQNFRPVELKEYVKCEEDIWLIDLKQEEILTDPKKIKYPYSEDAAKLDPDRLGGLVMDVVPQDSCLIFCPSRKNCENVALLLTKVLFSSLQERKHAEKIMLLKALQAEGSLCPILSRTIPFGIAYHHSGLMSDERRLLEDAFRSGILCVICCTSTLAAGVNLPARRVILRHPYVGSQFLNLSRYKQMIGRAGRAGMGEVGESILICKSNEISKVRSLLTSTMDDSLSTMHVEEDRGINNLILSSILLSLATTRTELHNLTSITLLGIQQKRLGVSAKAITDKTISTLMKTGAIKVKEKTTHGEINPNVTVVIPTQETPDKVESVPPKGKKTITLSRGTKLEVCQLGRAAMKGSIDLKRAHILYDDLKIAQKQLVLLDCLHLLYLVTPYDLADQIKPVGSVYYDVVTSLSRVQMETARVLGINEAGINKLRSGMMPRNVEPRVVNRFYLTLILYDLWNQHTVYVVSEKFQVNRGIVQNLLNASAAFASSVVRFCQELDEFWAFKDLLTTFGQKLAHCCSAELEPLMELPSVKAGRARQLFNADYKTLQSIAVADPNEMCEKIQYMPKRTVTQIIAAAKLLLLQKVENLRDEAEEVLDGLAMNLK